MDDIKVRVHDTIDMKGRRGIIVREVLREMEG